MDVPKKVFRLFYESDARKYSCGQYSPKELDENGPVYLDLSRKLVEALKLANVREVLIADINSGPYYKTFDNGMRSDYDVRKKPYHASTTILAGGRGNGSTIGIDADLSELSKTVDFYVSSNMDNQTLAIVHPVVADIMQLLLKDWYDVQVVKIKPQRKK